MAIPVLIIGKSGSGKSTSMQNCTNDNWNLIRVLNKPLPFRGKINGWYTDDYMKVCKCLSKSEAQSIVKSSNIPIGLLLTAPFADCVTK